VQCGTLHALLGLRGSADLQKAGPDLDAELILIDECSMLDAELFVHFLGRVRAGTRVVLMGDPDQLPPVEAGSLFADLVESQAVPTTLLTQCHRSEREEVLNLAAAIRHQRAEEVVARSRQDLLGSGSLERLFQAVKGEDFSQFRILSTVRKGPFGVDAINQFLAARLRAPQIPIMITRNDYRLGLSNGETGMLQGERAYFSDKEPIARAALPSFEYAYALSVHKSQGSEYKRVLFLLPPGSEVFGREVLYTGVTRARDNIELQASEETLRNTLKNGSRKLSSVRERISS
jgi:exodeoxyribonuclease V alpha subunit